MRFLQVNGNIHHKNQNALHRMTNSKQIEYVISSSRFNEDWDIVFVPDRFIPKEHFLNAKLIVYGPHLFPFDGEWQCINYLDSNICFNVLSNWNKHVHEEICNLQNRIKMVELPFAVDTENFKPVENKNIQYDCFIYFKRRNPAYLNYAKSVCDTLNLKYTVLTYNHYNEEHYKNVLSQSKFGIWIGTHESQGFALEEALSSGVPLVVWNVNTLLDEISPDGSIPWAKHKQHKLNATSVPYWDDRCGIKTNMDNLMKDVRYMLENYQTYDPRSYILENLTESVCMQRWIDLVK